MAHDIEGLTAAAICDALARRYDHRAHILDLITPTPGDVLFGQAATIRFFPNSFAPSMLSLTTPMRASP